MNLEDLQKIAYIKYVDVCRGDTCERLPFLKRRLDNKEKYEIVALKVEIETSISPCCCCWVAMRFIKVFLE